MARKIDRTTNDRSAQSIFEVGWLIAALFLASAIAVPACAPPQTLEAHEETSLEAPLPENIDARLTIEPSIIAPDTGETTVTWRYSVSPNGNGNSPSVWLGCSPGLPGVSDIHSNNSNESYSRSERSVVVRGLAQGVYECTMLFEYVTSEHGASYSLKRTLIVTDGSWYPRPSPEDDPPPPPPPPPPPAEPTFSGGNLEGLVGNEAVGWCAVTKGAQRLSSQVEVYLEGARVASVLTTVERTDVKEYIEGEYEKAGSDVLLTDAYFGFRYALRTAGTYGFVCVGGITLQNVTYSPPTAPTEPAPLPEFDGGNLDRLDGDVQFGWCAVTRGRERLSDEVDVYLNGAYLDSVPTDQHRPDAKSAIEEQYRSEGSFATLDDDLFGFSYPLGAPGRYGFRCGSRLFERDYEGDEDSDPPPFAPEASGGHIDRVDGGNVVRGWCAVTRGNERLSETVRVYLGGSYHGSTRTTERRPDVKAWVEENYREQGSFATIDEDRFGFSYTIDRAGVYTFDCGQPQTISLDTSSLPQPSAPPEFKGGNIDIRTGNVVEGWCGVTRGETRLSVQVAVSRNGQFHGTANTTIHRPDVKAAIQNDYRTNQNSFAQLDDDLFGFRYSLDQAGTYTFNCGGPDLVISYTP